MKPGDLQPEVVRKIAVLGPNKRFFGAQIVQLPFYSFLRRRFREAAIRVWSPSTAAVIEKSGMVASVCRVSRGLGGKTALVRAVRAFGPDLLINLRPQAGITHFAAVLSGTGFRAGFYSKPVTRFLYHHTVKDNSRIYKADNYLAMLEKFGAGTDEKEKLVARLAGEDTWQAPAGRTVICLMPGGGDGEVKRWGIDNFCALCKKLAERDPSAYFVFVLGGMEKEYVRVVREKLPEDTAAILLDAPLSRISRAVRSAVVTVTNDCGPSHLAHMGGGPVIGLWKRTGRRPLDVRRLEWFVHRENTRLLLPPEGGQVKDVPLPSVLKAADELLTV